MKEFRRHIGAVVRVDHTDGSSTGTLWSLTQRTMWLLVDETDVFIAIADVRTCEAAT